MIDPKINFVTLFGHLHSRCGGTNVDGGRSPNIRGVDDIDVRRFCTEVASKMNKWGQNKSIIGVVAYIKCAAGTCRFDHLFFLTKLFSICFGYRFL